MCIQIQTLDLSGVHSPALIWEAETSPSVFLLYLIL